MMTVGPSRLAGGERLVIDRSDGSVVDHLEQLLGEPLTVAVSIGSARVNRKPILQVFDAAGRSIAFAKLGITEETRDIVAAEAGALLQLEEADLTVEVPRLLSLSHWRDNPVLLMSALRTRATRPGDDRLPLAHMAAFSLSLGHTVSPLVEVPQWRRVRASITDDDRFAPLLAATETLAEGLPDVVVGAWHGDWTSWNMARSRRGGLQLWDFERFEQGAVHGLDAFHYCVNRATRRLGDGVDAISSGMHAALRASGGGQVGRLLGAVYLAVIAERYRAAAASEDLGHLIDARLEGCLAAWRSWLN